MAKVDALWEKLCERICRHLKSYDTLTLTSVVKKFLSRFNLSPPLLRWVNYDLFIEDSPNPRPFPSRMSMLDKVRCLPIANRDTLAFVMWHLKEVEANPDNNMDRDALVKVGFHT